MILLFAAATAAPLSYADALRRAADRSPSVIQAEASLRAADAGVLAATAPFGPTLSASGSTWGSVAESAIFGTQEAFSRSSGWFHDARLSETFATGTTLSAGLENSTTRYEDFDLEGFDLGATDATFQSKLSLSVGQALLQGVWLRYNLQGVRQATVTRDAAALSALGRRQQAIADTATAYWNLYYQRELLDIAEQSLELSREQARVVGVLVGDGRLAAVERTRIDAVVAESERALLGARSAAAGAEDQLLALFGDAPGGAVELTTEPTSPPSVELDEETVVEAVLAGNLDLRTLELQADEAAEKLRDARHARLPELGVTAGVDFSGYEPSFSEALKEMSSGDLRGWSVGASLSAPLLNRADRGASAAAEADLVRATSERHALALTVNLQARAQVRVIEDAQRRVELARLQLKLAEETLEAEMARFREGRTLQRDLISATRDREAARAEVGRALTDYQVAIIELQRLKGALGAP